MKDRVQKIKEVIKEISWSGPGEAYSDTGKVNPIRDDTQALLTGIVAAHKPATILEIGMAHGLSALCMLMGYTRAKLTTCEFHQPNIPIATKNFDEAGVEVEIWNGDAGVSIVENDALFDLVFIDHEKKLYLPHFQLLEEKRMLRSGCVVLADNVNDRRTECQDFVTYMEEKYHAKIIETECGLLIAKL